MKTTTRFLTIYLAGSWVKLDLNPLNSAQLVNLSPEANMSKQNPEPNQSTFAPQLKHLGKTPAEQLEKNKPLMDWLKKQIEEAETLSESEVKANQEYLEHLKQTLDSFRPEGHQLFQK